MKSILRYNSMATEWIEGLPLGNGANAMMVYGEAKKETFLLNHEWMWTTRFKKHFYTAEKIDELTQLVKDKNPKKFYEIFERSVTRETACNSFQPFCTLCVSLLQEGEINNYYRELNLEKAVAKLSYNIANNKINYEMFCDMNSPVMRIRLSSAEPIDLQLNYIRAESDDCTWKQSYSDGTFRFEGVLDDVHFLAVTRIIGNGEMDASSMCLKKTTSVEFQIVLTNTLITDSLELYVKKALENTNPFYKAEEEHIKVFSKQFNRCRLDLKHNDIRMTDEIFMEGQKNSKPSLAWYELVADMARYVLMCSSQKGTLPCNLQGKWNPEVKPEWDGGYTTDMNLQMFYWCANKTQLFESQFALFDWIDSLKNRMQSLAKDIFGVKNAFYIPQYTDCFMEPTCWKGGEGAFQTLWGGAASWLAQNYYEYWKYTGDNVFLKERAFPFMKGCAEFYMQLLKKGSDGKWHLYISTAPENPAADGAWIIDTATMDIALIHELFTHLLEINEYLGNTESDATKWRGILENLVEYPIDNDGVLQEWVDDRIPCDPGHRHLSHIYPLYPGKECYTDKTLESATKKALKKRLDNNWGQAAAWSFAWYSCCFARLGDSVREQQCMHDLLIGAILINGLSVYSEFSDRKDISRQYALGNRRVYQADAMLGYYAAVGESLLQCYDNHLILLPSLIDDWKKGGSVYGLAAYGGITVDLSWENGMVKALTLYASYDRELFIETKEIPVKSTVPINIEKGGFSVLIKAGEVLSFAF